MSTLSMIPSPTRVLKISSGSLVVRDLYLYTVRPDNTLSVRFSLTLDREPEIEVALAWTLRAHDLLMELHATDVVGSSAYSRWDSRLLP